MTLITRAQWGARKPKSTPTKVSLSARTATCTHHDGKYPVVLRTFAEACARVRADQNYHMDSQGWNDIGYNYLVISAPSYPAIDGLIFEGRGRDVVGAHCLNWNTPWIGIQVTLGGGQTPSPKALASTRWLHDTFATAAGHALAKKVHSDGFPTACPDPKLRTWVHSGMPVTKPPEVDVPLTSAEMNAIADLTVHKLLLTNLGRSDTNVAEALQTASGVSAAAIAAKVVALLALQARQAG